LKEPANENLPLAGIRVIDLTIWIFGPLAASLLGDMGAEVIKVERPVTGDFSRGAQSIWGRNLRLPDDKSSFWEFFNRNKKGITLDLNKAEGREILYRLAEKSDVFITNLSPPALERFGANQKTILEHNPEIIYAQGSGLGRKGPDANAPCQDTVGIARSGFMFNIPLAGDEPSYVTGAISDVLAGTMLAFGILASLISKQRLGITQAVYTSQLNAMLWLQYWNLAHYCNFGVDFEPHNRKKSGNPLFNMYKCKDGKWLALGMFVSDRYWHDFCEVMGIKELEKDPRFAMEVDRKEHCEELISILEKIFITKPREEWAKPFTEKEFWFSIINKVADLPTDPQVVANDLIVELENRLKLPTGPFQLEKSKIPLRGKSPEFGQDTEEVLIDICGLSWKDIEALKDDGVI